MGEMQPARLSRGLQRQLSYVEGATVMGQARELQAAQIARERIVNGQRLAAESMALTGQLSRLAVQVSQNNPELQMELAVLEESFVLGCQALIQRYMNR